MTELNASTETAAREKRANADRRSHKHDDLFTYAVTAGYFIDLRKGERRQSVVQVEIKL